MYKITNTANDRTKANLHRTASKFILEPTFQGIRLGIRDSRLISDDDFEKNRELLEGWEKKGMISIERPEEETKPGLPGDPGLDAPGVPPVEEVMPSEEEQSKFLNSLVPPKDEPLIPETVNQDTGAAESTTSEELAKPEPPASGYKKGSGKKKLF